MSCVTEYTFVVLKTWKPKSQKLIHTNWSSCGFLGGSAVTRPPTGGVDSILGSGRSPREGKGNHSSTLIGDIHGQGSLVGYSSWSSKKPDTTERINNNNHLRVNRAYSGNWDKRQGVKTASLKQPWWENCCGPLALCFFSSFFVVGGEITGLGTRNWSITMVLLFPVFLMRHKDTKSPGRPGTTSDWFGCRASCLVYVSERWVGLGVGGLEKMQPIQAMEPNIEKTTGSLRF